MTTLTMDNPINYSGLNGIFAPVSYAYDWNRNLPLVYATPSRAILSDVGDTLTFLQSKGVVIEEFSNVESFLTNNSSIVAHLYDIPNKVSDYFGDTSLKLSVFSDPDQENDFQQIFFEIDTALSPKDANKKLSELNRDWLLKINDKDVYLLNFSLNFI